jgi:hypothetical protein
MQYTQNSASKATTVIDRAIKYINATPPAISGNNGHSQTFALASNLVHGLQLDGSVVTELLMNHYNPKCEPAWTFAELEHKVIDAAKTKPNKPSGYLLKGREKKIGTISRPMRKTPVPKVDPVENIQKFIGNFRCQEQDLIDASPYKLTGIIQGEHFHRQGAMLIEYLYETDDLIRIVTSSRESEKGKHHPVGYGQTLPRNVWSSAILQAPQHKSEGGCWIGMNPVDGNGVADKNVTRFPYALFEIDDVSLELQLSIIAKLPMAFSAIIYSGGRSYHCWVKVPATNIDQYKNSVSSMCQSLKVFGADTKNKNASRMSRLPGVYRGDQQQRLVYLNPEPSIESIL